MQHSCTVNLIKRRDREQVIGSEDNRGGGLIIGAKETIPVSVIKNDLMMT